MKRIGFRAGSTDEQLLEDPPAGSDSVFDEVMIVVAPRLSIQTGWQPSAPRQMERIANPASRIRNVALAGRPVARLMCDSLDRSGVAVD